MQSIQHLTMKSKMSPVRNYLVAIVLLTVAACAPADEFHFELGEIEFAAPLGSAEPNLFAAPAHGGRVLLSWHEPTGDERHALRVAMRTPDGWSAPTTVAEDRDFFVNWADFPSVIEEVDGALVVHWLEWVAARRALGGLRLGRVRPL